MTGIRKLAALCGMAALLAIAAFAPTSQADEPRFQERSVTEGHRGGRRFGGGWRHGGGGWDHRGGGWHHGGGCGW